MSKPEDLKDVLDGLVIPDKAAKPGTVDAEATSRALKALLAGGRERLIALVGMLTEPGKGDDSKARYALHALAVRVSAAKDDRQRRLFTESLASVLGGERPKAVQAFIVRQLQVAGREEVVPALGKVLLDDDLGEPALEALLAIRSGAAAQVRTALAKAEGKRRVALVQALGTLRDTEAVASLRKLAGGKDGDARLAASWALANIGDPGAVEVFAKLPPAEGAERFRYASAALLLAERLRDAGKKDEAAKVYRSLKERHTGTDEAHVRDAAARGLAGLK